MSEGAKIWQLMHKAVLRLTDKIPMSDEAGIEPTFGVSIGQLTATIAEALASTGIAAPVFIPTPLVEARGQGEGSARTNEILLSWNKCQDLRFLAYQPKFILFRYKESMKSVKRNPLTSVTVKKKISAKWSPPLDGADDIHNPTRLTQWPVSALPLPLKTTVPFDHSQWFRVYEAQTFYVEAEGVTKGNKTFLPKGSKDSFNQMTEDRRRNIFMRFAMQITIEGKNYLGGFSQELKIGYTRVRKAGGQTDVYYSELYNTYYDNYQPMIQLV